MSSYTDKLIKLISLHEGRIATPYKDSLGLWTCGVGHLCDRNRGGSLHPSWKAFPLTEQEIDNALTDDIDSAWKSGLTVAPWIASLGDPRRAAITDMLFNLGPLFLTPKHPKSWPLFIMQMTSGQFSAAATNMRSTLWASQTKNRAARLANMIETGEWPDGIS